MSRKFHRAAYAAVCSTLATAAILASLPASAAVVAADSAPASPDPAEAPRELPQLEEVIITARRRGENLEKVPVSVSAIDSDQLSRRSITTEQDLQSAVPGLIVQETEVSNNLSFSIRGQGIDAESGSRPGVLPYVDDIQINTATASTFFDLASVQVLKGPQGTLFGRNATGGAVLYTTAKPTNDFSGYATIKGGNFGFEEVQGAINLPLIDDKLLLRVAGDALDRHGYVNNTYVDGTNDSRLGNIEDRAVRVSLIARPFDGLENTTVFHYETDNGTNIGPQLYSAYACGSKNNGVPLATSTTCVFGPTLDAIIGVPGLWNAYLAAHPQAPAGGLAAYVAQQRAMGLYTVSIDNASSHRSHNYWLSNTTTYDVTDNVQLKNIIGLADASARDNSDLDGSPYGVIAVRNTDGSPSMSLKATRQFSDEFQLLGKAFDQRLSYIVGGYYGYEKDTDILPTAVVDLTPIIPPTANQKGAILKDFTGAVFTQETYDLSDVTGVQGLSTTAGVRFTYERNEIAQSPLSNLFGAPDETQTTHQPSWQIGLEYQMTPSLMAYVTSRGSFRSGGFNVVAPATLATAEGGGNEFLPEKTHDVEIGSKFQGALSGIPLRLNVAVYDQWVDHVQRAVYVDVPPNNAIASVTANVPSAEIRGVEGDLMLAPSTWLELGGNLAFTNAAYTNGTESIFGNNYQFGPYANAPRWSGSVYGQVTLPLPPSLGEPAFRVDAYAQSLDYFSNLAATASPQTSIAGYGLINLRMDWRDFLVKGVTVSAFGKNVADKRYYVGGIALGAGLGINGAIPGPPRMYGAELSYKF